MWETLKAKVFVPSFQRRLVFHALPFLLDHLTLRFTPAMEAGIAGHVWNMAEAVALLP
jgi:hypothetical protein